LYLVPVFEDEPRVVFAFIVSEEATVGNADIIVMSNSPFTVGGFCCLQYKLPVIPVLKVKRNSFLLP
jgi:hypothetical protein